MKRQNDKNFRTGRIKNLPIIAVLTFLMFVMTFGMAFAEDSGISPDSNLAKAMELYGIDSSHVEFLQAGAPYEDIRLALRDLKETAEPTIVYAPSGTYDITGTDNLVGNIAGLTVPENVVFVAEDDSVFVDKKNDDSHPLVMVRGSIYGGHYKNARFTIKFKNDINFDAQGSLKTEKRRVNGQVEYVKVSNLKGKKNSTASGIQAIGTRGVEITHNIITEGRGYNTTAIDLQGSKNYGGSANSISNNTISNIGSNGYGSGISVTHSDAKSIIGNSIKNVAGHGISTDAEQSGKAHRYVCIDYITGNKIDNAKNGIWLERGCQVLKGINKNDIRNIKVNGISASSGTTVKKKWVKETRYNKGKYSIKSMKNNTIYNCKRSCISITGKYAAIVMHGDNLISKSTQTNAITMDHAAKLYINGNNNRILNSKGNGIYLQNRSYLNIKGKNTRITNNKGFGVNVTSKSRAIVKNTNAKGNKKYSFRVCKGSRLRIYKCKKDKILKTTKTV